MFNLMFSISFSLRACGYEGGSQPSTMSRAWPVFEMEALTDALEEILRSDLGGG